MNLTPGVYDAVIKSNMVGSSASKGTLFVKLNCTVSEEAIDVLIYITKKGAGLARAQLKKCGFDSDTQTLADVRDNPELLAGNKLKVVGQDEDKYGLQFRVQMQDISNKRMETSTQMLRDAKKNGKESETETDGEDLPF